MTQLQRGQRHDRPAGQRFHPVPRDHRDRDSIPRAPDGHPGQPQEVPQDLGVLMSKRRAELEVSAGGIVFRRIRRRRRGSCSFATPTTTGASPRVTSRTASRRPKRRAGRRRRRPGSSSLVLQGPIRVIDWHFRFRGRHIHKYCHFFLFESPDGEPCPQVDEGITDCQWRIAGRGAGPPQLRQRARRAQAGRRDGPDPGGGRGRAGGGGGGRTGGTIGTADTRERGAGRPSRATRSEAAPGETKPPTAVPPSTAPPTDMAAIAALLESRAAVLALRRTLPRGRRRGGHLPQLRARSGGCSRPGWSMPSCSPRRPRSCPSWPSCEAAFRASRWSPMRRSVPTTATFSWPAAGMRSRWSRSRAWTTRSWARWCARARSPPSAAARWPRRRGCCG